MANRKRYVVTLGEGELQRLSAFAKANDVSRSVALMRLLRKALRDAEETLPKAEVVDERQLSIFDAIQVDIFNNTSKSGQ